MATGRRRRQRLTRSGDFDRVFRQGTSRGNRFFVLYVFPREGEDAGADARLGVSVGRKVGGAVQRNAVKRAVREAFWPLAEGSESPRDFVVVARPDAAGLVERAGTTGVAESLTELLGESAPLEERST